MKGYEIYGARLLVRRLQDEAAKDSQLTLPVPNALLPPGVSSHGGFSAPVAGFSKGYVVAIGKPCEPQGDDDDTLSSPVIGGEDSDRFGFREVMREVVGAMAKMQLGGGTVMPPVAIGDVVIFASFRASLMPGESDLFLVGGEAVVARVEPGDFEGQKNA
jgi:hypothetical protein